jgi:hypothetical protein
MRNYLYEVLFQRGGNLIVSAECDEHAIILARAEKIKAGLDDHWTNVRKIK